MAGHELDDEPDEKQVPVTLKQRGRPDRETVVQMPVGAKGLEARDEQV